MATVYENMLLKWDTVEENILLNRSQHGFRESRI